MRSAQAEETGTILVVGDESSVRQALRVTLSGMAFLQSKQRAATKHCLWLACRGLCGAVGR